VIFTSELKYLPIVQAAADKWGVPTALLMAHIKQESAWNEKAFRDEPQISDFSVGLMQLLTGTARTLDPSVTPDQLYDPSVNVDLGAKLIAKNLTRYSGDLKSSIASFNSGSAFVNENGEFTNSKGSTIVNDYVTKVMKNYDYYTSWLDNGAKSFDITLPGTDMNVYLLGIFGILTAYVLYSMTKSRKTEV
jgi:soluble lytic murein transglycosylase-like protein